MESLPIYIPIVFILTTLVTFALFVFAIKPPRFGSGSAWFVVAVIPLWALVQGIVAATGYYLNTTAMPPPFLVFAPLPTLLFIVLYFLFASKDFANDLLSLQALTLVHVVRIPVEIVLYWLASAKAIPVVMTFVGWNFDIASGVLALVVYFTAFRGSEPKRWLIAIFNVVGLLLLANIVITAILSLPTAIQKFPATPPNRAVLYFPYIWLPTIIVPIVLFSHLASIWQLIKPKLRDH